MLNNEYELIDTLTCDELCVLGKIKSPRRKSGLAIDNKIFDKQCSCSINLNP